MIVDLTPYNNNNITNIYTGCTLQQVKNCCYQCVLYIRSSQMPCLIERLVIDYAQHWIIAQLRLSLFRLASIVKWVFFNSFSIPLQFLNNSSLVPLQFPPFLHSLSLSKAIFIKLKDNNIPKTESYSTGFRSVLIKDALWNRRYVSSTRRFLWIVTCLFLIKKFYMIGSMIIVSLSLLSREIIVKN